MSAIAEPSKNQPMLHGEIWDGQCVWAECFSSPSLTVSIPSERHERPLRPASTLVAAIFKGQGSLLGFAGSSKCFLFGGAEAQISQKWRPCFWSLRKPVLYFLCINADSEFNSVYFISPDITNYKLASEGSIQSPPRECWKDMKWIHVSAKTKIDVDRVDGVSFFLGWISNFGTKLFCSFVSSAVYSSSISLRDLGRSSRLGQCIPVIGPLCLGKTIGHFHKLQYVYV